MPQHVEAQQVEAIFILFFLHFLIANYSEVWYNSYKELDLKGV